jgi:hypothetical protein
MSAWASAEQADPPTCPTGGTPPAQHLAGVHLPHTRHPLPRSHFAPHGLQGIAAGSPSVLVGTNRMLVGLSVVVSDLAQIPSHRNPPPPCTPTECMLRPHHMH